MPETTDHREALAPDLPTSSVAINALPRLTYAPEPTSAPNAVRGLNHPHELVLRGIPAMCSACGARRDWLLINQGRKVWIRCRCGHQWFEPEISRAGYEAMVAIPDGTTYPSVTQGLLALGFDGAFAGTYLEQSLNTDTFNPAALQRHWDRLLPLLDRALANSH